MDKEEKGKEVLMSKENKYIQETHDLLTWILKETENALKEREEQGFIEASDMSQRLITIRDNILDFLAGG